MKMTSAPGAGPLSRRASILLCLLLQACVTSPATSQQVRSSKAVDRLGAISEGLETLTAETLRCVVSITGETYVPEQDYYGDRAKESNVLASASQTEGSGIIVSSDGYVVTNAHVVIGERNLRVAMRNADGAIEESGARVIGIDRVSDLAVLKISGNNLPFINLEQAKPAKQGEITLAFGNPYGMERTVTMGIVSATDRQMAPDDPRLWIQTDAAINPGNSGGPLVDVRGHLLGINTLVYSESGGYEGIALAIPAMTVREVFHGLVEHGRVERVTLGLAPLAFDSGIAKALRLDRPYGILAEDVVVGGPAFEAGMQPGDVLVDIDGHEATNIVEFSRLLKTLKPKVPVNVNVWRATGPQVLHITPVVDEADSLPLAARINARRNLIQRLEILAVTIDAGVERLVGPTRYRQGVVVAARSSTLRIGSDALQVRDIIYQVNGQQVTDVKSLREVLKGIPDGSPLVLQIERDHNLHYVPVGTL
jgi:serine protease Do